ncbi:hypothetical protein ACFE04_025309 [Oxalis oulophora]
MKLVVEILSGSLFYIQVENNATIADLKNEIGIQQKLPVDRMVLFLDDKNQAPGSMIKEEDSTLLIDCGFKEESHIYLFFSPDEPAKQKSLLDDVTCHPLFLPSDSNSNSDSDWQSDWYPAYDR